MKCPTMEDVESADKLLLATWCRHLPIGTTLEQLNIVNRVCERFNELGGWTPELSKQVGWDAR